MLLCSTPGSIQGWAHLLQVLHVCWLYHVLIPDGSTVYACLTLTTPLHRCTKLWKPAWLMAHGTAGIQKVS